MYTLGNNGWNHCILTVLQMSRYLPTLLNPSKPSNEPNSKIVKIPTSKKSYIQNCMVLNDLRMGVRRSKENCNGDEFFSRISQLHLISHREPRNFVFTFFSIFSTVSQICTLRGKTTVMVRKVSVFSGIYFNQTTRVNQCIA